MGWLDMFGGRTSDPATYTAPRGIPSPDEARTLALYKYDSCPYCRRVLRALEGLEGVEVELRDTLMEPANRRALMERTGRTQVPALVIDDVVMFESADIVDWLEAYAIRGARAD